MSEPGLFSINVIAASVSPAGDGVFNAETISASVAAALAGDPEAFTDVLCEFSYKLHERSMAERLRFRDRMKIKANNRAFEAIEFLYDPEQAGKDSLYDLMQELDAHYFHDVVRWAKLGKALEANPALVVRAPTEGDDE